MAVQEKASMAMSRAAYVQLLAMAHGERLDALAKGYGCSRPFLSQWLHRHRTSARLQRYVEKRYNQKKGTLA